MILWRGALTNFTTSQTRFFNFVFGIRVFFWRRRRILRHRFNRKKLCQRMLFLRQNPKMNPNLKTLLPLLLLNPFRCPKTKMKNLV